jgi:hypothetical protein
MNREHDDSVELIDLGVASVETQGGGSGLPDIVDNQKTVGLSDD